MSWMKAAGVCPETAQVGDLLPPHHGGRARLFARGLAVRGTFLLWRTRRSIGIIFSFEAVMTIVHRRHLLYVGRHSQVKERTEHTSGRWCAGAASLSRTRGVNATCFGRALAESGAPAGRLPPFFRRKGTSSPGTRSAGLRTVLATSGCRGHSRRACWSASSNVATGRGRLGRVCRLRRLRSRDRHRRADGVRSTLFAATFGLGRSAWASSFAEVGIPARRASRIGRHDGGRHEGALILCARR